MAEPSFKEPLYILYLDRHHLGDELFLKSLAQHFSQATGAPPCLLVHGSGEKVERTLEAQGYFPERRDGVLEIESEEQRRLVERAVREVNQEIVAALTDQVVSTVGIQGVDRGLLTEDASRTLAASNVGWVTALLKQHIVPVVSALVEDPSTDRVREVPTVEAIEVLADALGATFDPVVCTFPRGDAAGLMTDEGDVRSTVSVDAIGEDDVSDLSAVQALSEAEIPVLITNLQGLLRGEEPSGTRLEPQGSSEA